MTEQEALDKFIDAAARSILRRRKIEGKALTLTISDIAAEFRASEVEAHAIRRRAVALFEDEAEAAI